MRKPPRLQKRSHRFFCRVAVPSELREIIGKHEIVRALGTGDYAEALRRLPLKSAEINSELSAAKRKLANSPATRLSDHNAREIALQWLWQCEQAVEVQPEEAEEAAEVYAIDIATLSDANNPNTRASVERLAKSLMERNHLSLNLAESDFWRLSEMLRRAALEQARRREARLQGNFAAAFDPVFHSISADSSKPPVSRELTNSARPSTLSGLCDAFLADPARSRVGPKTRVDYAFTFKLLKQALGPDKEARQVNRADCRRICDLLSGLPPNAGKRWPGIPLEQVAAFAREQGVEPMAPRTANAYLHKLSALFRWAEREEFVPRNPAVGLRVAEVEIHKREARLPFDAEQLKKIFGSPLYIGCQDDEYGYYKPGHNVIKRWRYWLLPIALFSGLRMNEICSLQVCDIEDRDGVTCFIICPDEEGQKRLKTRSAARVLPIHPALKKMGLLTYVAKMRERGVTWLWPELVPDKRGYRSDAAQKWFGRFLVKAGAHKSRTSFHSSRHNFRDALREGGTPQEAVHQLGGWAGNGGTSDDYGRGLKPKTLFRWIRRVAYPELDLDHLYDF